MLSLLIYRSQCVASHILNRKYTNDAEVRDVSWIVKPENLHRPSKKGRNISIMAISSVRNHWRNDRIIKLEINVSTTDVIRNVSLPISKIKVQRELQCYVRN